MNVKEFLELSQANLSPQAKLDEDRAHLEGARAKRSGVDFHDNPYPKTLLGRQREVAVGVAGTAPLLSGCWAPAAVVYR